MTDLEKFEWIHCAIQEALKGYNGWLEEALGLIEALREPLITKTRDWSPLNIGDQNEH